MRCVIAEFGGELKVERSRGVHMSDCVKKGITMGTAVRSGQHGIPTNSRLHGSKRIRRTEQAYAIQI
jgi:hypothetical protein